ncbi:hypothetical protein QQP08_019783 [Theobroma cacao]|nr:hypothetical protein QQP08_019783 [Theobroma cacao]
MFQETQRYRNKFASLHNAETPRTKPKSTEEKSGVSRDEETLLPTVYLNKLPDKFPEGSRVFVVDLMLATGTNLHLTVGNLMLYPSYITMKLYGIFPSYFIRSEVNH